MAAMHGSRTQGLALCFAALLGIDCTRDEIRVSNTDAGEEWGLLIDGTATAGAIDDRVAIGSADRIELDNLHASAAAREEVIGFTRGRPVKLLEAVAWTPAETDVVNLAFSPVIVLPVTVWIVATPSEELEERAVEHALTTASIWRAERVGLELSLEIVDVTGHADAWSFSDFACSMRQAMMAAMGSRPSRFNVYWVDTVNGSTYAGSSCALGSGFVAMGRDTSDDLLVHELGHGLGLEHTDAQSGFGHTNVMHSASSTREFLTEGQVFRAHVDPGSVLNGLYGARAGEPTRVCAHSASDASCPGIGTRIWSDATPPPP